MVNSPNASIVVVIFFIFFESSDTIYVLNCVFG